MNIPSSAPSESARVPALLALVGLFFFAIVFWKERVFFGDASWISFLLINFGKLQIQEHRYGSFITQSVPLLASKMGLSLRTVLLLYSVSFNAFYLLAGGLLFRWRQYSFLLLLALYFTVSFSVGFYWTNNEVHQGMAWLMLFFGWASRAEKWDWVFYTVAFALCFLALSSHMLLLLVAGCLWIHLLLAKRAPFYGTRKGVFLALFAVAAAVWRYYMSKVEGWYDADKLSFIDNLTFSKVGEAFKVKSSHDFFSSWFTHYPALPALVLLSFFVLLVQKRWLAAGWHLISLAAFWFFISAAFADFTAWYSESDWASWTLAAMIPLALYGFPFRRKSIGAGFLVLVFALSLLRIYQSAAPFQKRLLRVEKLVATLQNRDLTKVAILIPDNKPLEEKIILSWPLPSEVYSLSAISGRKPVISIGLIGEQKKLPPTPNLMLIPFDNLSASYFKPSYFPVDSTTPYTVFPTDSLMHWLE